MKRPSHPLSSYRLLSLLLLVALLAVPLAGTALADKGPVSPDSIASPAGDAAISDIQLARLNAETGGEVEVAYHAYTGKVRYLAAPPTAPIAAPATLAADASPEDAARGFLAEYGALFGVTDPYGDLSVMRSQQAEEGRSFVRFQQTHAAIPVLGGELVVQMDGMGNVISANGEILPEIAAPATAVVVAEQASAVALELVAKHYEVAADSLEASEPALWYYNPALLGASGSRETALVWRVEVRARDLLPIREFVLIDARNGAIRLNFSQIATGKNRVVYDNNNNPSAGLPGIGPVRSEGQGPTGNNDVDKAYDYAGNTYDFYFSTHGRDSLDGFGMSLISTVRYCDPSQPCPYQNAFWNGAQMAYGQGFASADDVVAHELTHGVTQYESNLFYYMQSGAINEALSDIWGEFVDLTNGAGDDTAGVRWLMGEDLTGIGAIRSMSNPPAFGDPDRVGSASYSCGDPDNGGVHTNSGVANKTAYLMTDGGSFNGQTVTALGITKAARIWYRAQTNLLTSAADFQDLHELLPQACVDQIGTNGITTADCQEVRDAVDATEMGIQPTNCPALEAPVCGVGGNQSFLFFDNLENPSSGRWLSSATTGTNTWYYPQNPNPLGETMHYGTSGQYHFWGWDGPQVMDANIRMTTGVALPAGATAYLRFNHAYSFEASANGTWRFDGGVVEVSTDGGASWQDTGSFPSGAKVNWYNGAIATGQGNPLAGRDAFSWRSNGYTSSRLNLGSLAGQNVRFRFRIGTDSGIDDFGWFIDDIGVYVCTGTASHFTFLPLVIKSPPPPTGPTPGFWDDGFSGGMEFYVSPDRQRVENFAIFVNVFGCGLYRITRITPVSISGANFSFAGSHYASGAFSSATSASGNTGLVLR